MFFLRIYLALVWYLLIDSFRGIQWVYWVVFREKLRVRSELNLVRNSHLNWVEYLECKKWFRDLLVIWNCTLFFLLKFYFGLCMWTGIYQQWLNSFCQFGLPSCYSPTKVKVLSGQSFADAGLILFKVLPGVCQWLKLFPLIRNIFSFDSFCSFF